MSTDWTEILGEFLKEDPVLPEKELRLPAFDDTILGAPTAADVDAMPDRPGVLVDDRGQVVGSGYTAADVDAMPDRPGVLHDDRGQVVGADTADRAVVVRVRDVGKLVAKEGGAMGGLAFKAAPDTISDTVYGKIAAELKKGFNDKGVDVDVHVSRAAPPAGRGPSRDLVTGLVAGAAGVGVVYGLYRLVRGLVGRARAA